MKKNAKPAAKSSKRQSDWNSLTSDEQWTIAHEAKYGFPPGRQNSRGKGQWTISYNTKGVLGHLADLVEQRRKIEASTPGELKAWRREAARFRKTGWDKLHPIPPAEKRGSSYNFMMGQRAYTFAWVRATAPGAVAHVMTGLLDAIERRDHRMFSEIARILESTPDNEPLRIEANPAAVALELKMTVDPEWADKEHSIDELEELCPNRVDRTTWSRIAKVFGIKIRGRGRPRKITQEPSPGDQSG